jgi:subtilase family serine protease
VEFRWFDAAGNLIRKAQKVTSPCTQPGELPNLQVRAPTAQAGPGGTAVYIVPIANTGKETAHNIAVELFVDGAATNVGHIDAIAPGQTREARFTGPLCQRSLRAVADPTDAVKERFESDNALQVKCPSPGA